MKKLALHEMGEVIRKVRKERGLRLEDLSDDNISPATVSNIERGVAHVSPEKITYLLEKLDLSMHKIPDMLKKEQDEIQKVKFQLLVTTSLYKSGNAEESLILLESMALEESHPFIGSAYYVKGLCYLQKNKWRQAERNLHHALRHTQQSNQSNPELEAQIYYQLSKVHQTQYSLIDAIERVDQGLRVLDEADAEGIWKERLLCQKAEYHYLQEETLEGYQFVLDHWETLSQSADCEIRTTISWLRAEFLFQLGYLEQTIEIASHAVEQSQHLYLPLLHNRLWTLLGKVYTHTENWELADLSFQMAMRQNLHLSTASYDLIYTLVEYSKLYQKQEKWQPAYTYLEKAVSLSKKHQVKDQYLNTLMMLGNLCHESGQKPDEAIRLLQQTLELAQKHEQLDLELDVWFSLAKCYEQQNDEAFHHCLRKGYELKKRVSQGEKKRKPSMPK